ncbi:MAG TPA: homoserine dehydrogenase [Bacteroidales bacterium]
MSYYNQLNIGLFGFGVVGEGIYKVLEQKPQLHATIKKICIKHPEKDRNAPAELFTTDADDILNDKTIDVVVELINDAAAAMDITRKAMNSGKSVVSANKKMIAENMAELLDLQRKNKVSFLYEAAVCGSVPIIRNLEEYFDNDLLTSVSGIVNGSTNFILSEMAGKKIPYLESLKKAQELGFAETDPSLDVEGIDAAYKLSIILFHAFGLLIDYSQIIRKGIVSIDSFDFQYALEKRKTIKLVATTKWNSDNTLTAYVLPTFVNKNTVLSTVHNEYNGVLIGSTLADEQFLFGKGAGRYPTSSAVLSDISALKYDYKYAYKKSQRNQSVQLKNEQNITVYISFSKNEKIDLDLFSEIHESFVGKERSYLIGDIPFQALVNSDFWRNEQFSIIANPAFTSGNE